MSLQFDTLHFDNTRWHDIPRTDRAHSATDQVKEVYTSHHGADTMSSRIIAYPFNHLMGRDDCTAEKTTKQLPSFFSPRLRPFH